MSLSPFRQLYRVIGSAEELSVVYRDVLKKFVHRSFWVSGTVELRRVLWTDGRRARTEDPDTFASCGLYLWGIENRMIYIGITTRDLFKERFSRYIWSKQSQCNWAREHEDALIARGMEGFPSETLKWYAKNHSGTTRPQGAIRFAEEGIDKVWFGLLPHDNQKEIKGLERCLIPVAEAWNRKCGFRSLLNIEFNKRR